MSLSEEALRQQLSRPFRYFDSLASTNDAAKTWLMADAPELASVIADEQRQGRGRKGGRVWHTPPGRALALTVILRPPARCLPRVNMIGALSVYDLAQAVGCGDIGIKWPNDVQVQSKKLSGVLPEAIWEGGELLGVALGIGVNVRMDFTGTELENRAISLEDAVDTSLNRAELIAMLLQSVEDWYRLIDTDAVFTTWRSRLNLPQGPVQIDAVKGIALDVGAAGELLLQDERAQIHRISAGIISAVSEG